ncbi:MAG: guanylate kinase [Oscillospiraceae bacterium]
MMNKQRLLLVVSGPSGVGKDSVVQDMVAKHPGIEVSVSATTRSLRAGEQDGVNYHYISRDQFQEYIRQNAFCEYATYAGEYYGTLKSEVDDRISKGTICVLVIEVQGAANIKKLYPGCTTVFILPPSLEVLEQRIRWRGRESEEEVKRRIAVAKEVEIPFASTYDYRIVNHNLESCAEELYQIIKAQQLGA